MCDTAEFRNLYCCLILLSLVFLLLSYIIKLPICYRTSRLRDRFFPQARQANEQSELIHTYSTLPLYGMPCTAL